MAKRIDETMVKFDNNFVCYHKIKINIEPEIALLFWLAIAGWILLWRLL